MSVRAHDDRTMGLDFTAALERRDQGVERSVAHANRVESEWSGQALALLVAYAIEVKRPFLVEEVRPWAEARGLPPPPDARAWGGIARRAKAKQRIQKVGAAAAASSNASLKVLWQLPPPPGAR